MVGMGVWLLAAWCAMVGASAQEVTPADVPATAPPVPAPRDLDHVVWREAGPTGLEDAAAVVLAPGARGGVVVVAADGAVWRSTDLGRSWARSLAPTGSALGDGSTDEDILLNAETRLQELIADLDLDELGVVDEASLEAVMEEQADALQQATDATVDELPSDAQSGGWFSEVRAAPQAAPAQAWWFEGRPLVVSRADGLWVDGERSWSRVREAVDHLAPRPGGGWVAVDGVGVWLSDDLVAWRWVQDVPPVRHLAASGDGVLLATEGGVLQLGPGDRLSAWGARRDAWDVLEVDGWRAGAAWVANARGVWRTEDGGTTYVPAVGAPMLGVTTFRADAAGVLFAQSPEDVWVSRDGGQSFRRLPEGLPQAPRTGLSVWGDQVWVSTERGVFRLTQDDEIPSDAVADAAFPPVGLLLAAAEARVAGLTRRRQGREATQLLRWLTPQAVIEYRWDRGDARATRLDAGLTLRADGDSTIHAWLEWRPPRQSSSGMGDASSIVVQEGDDGPRIYAGSFDAWMMLGSVGRRITDARLKVTNTITELASNRALLIRERGRAAGDLLDDVHLELRIAEIDAWLDALTDGAVHRYRAGQAEGGG